MPQDNKPVQVTCAPKKRKKGDAALEPKYLTQDEVNKLPDRTVVMVQWSGEVGPHRYQIVQLGDGKARVNTMEKEALSFVGKEKWHTKVWFPEN